MLTGRPARRLIDRRTQIQKKAMINAGRPEEPTRRRLLLAWLVYGVKWFLFVSLNYAHIFPDSFPMVDAKMVQFMSWTIVGLVFALRQAYATQMTQFTCSIVVQTISWQLLQRYETQLIFPPLCSEIEMQTALLSCISGFCFGLSSLIALFAPNVEYIDRTEIELQNIYKECDPVKIKDTGKVLKKYKGNEKLLFARLEAKHNLKRRLDAKIEALRESGRKVV